MYWSWDGKGNLIDVKMVCFSLTFRSNRVAPKIRSGRTKMGGTQTRQFCISLKRSVFGIKMWILIEINRGSPSNQQFLIVQHSIVCRNLSAAEVVTGMGRGEIRRRPMAADFGDNAAAPTHSVARTFEIPPLIHSDHNCTPGSPTDSAMSPVRSRRTWIYYCCYSSWSATFTTSHLRGALLRLTLRKCPSDPYMGHV